jgi:Mrp family chromosome partitioning ATPase
VSELREHLSVIWRHKWIVILSIVVITSVAVGATLMFSTPLYQSSTELLQRRSGVDRVLLGSDLFGASSSSPDRDLQTAAKMVKSPEVVSAVTNHLGDELGGRNPVLLVAVNAVKQTDILEISATDPNPQVASDVANAFTTEYVKWRQQVDHDILAQARGSIELQLKATPVEQQDTPSYKSMTDKLETLKMFENMQTNNLEVIKPAIPAVSPVSPKPVRTGLVAFVASLILGVGSVFVVERLDTRIRHTDEITRRIDRPILASVPGPVNLKGSLITLSHPSGSYSEAFRLLKTNLGYVEPDKEIKSIMVTSPEPGDGKSTIIANLAVTMARSGQRVIVIEGDLRRPKLSQYMDLSNTVGVTNVIAGDCSFREALQMIEADDLTIASGGSPEMDDAAAYGIPLPSTNGIKPIYIVTSGPVPPNPGELAASEKMASLISEARGHADIVLVDAPPLGVVGDAASMASKVDGVVMVMRLAQTSKKSIADLQNFIERVPCNVLGMVINNSGANGSYNSGYAYYEQSGYY